MSSTTPEMVKDMRRISASDARKEFAEIVNRVAYGKERVVIGRRGKELAAVVPIADLRRLERLVDDLEDRVDAAAALEVEADKRDRSDPWDKVKAKSRRALSGGGEKKRTARPRVTPPTGSGTNRQRTRRAR
jgi:prevent-host-death family protein